MKLNFNDNKMKDKTNKHENNNIKLINKTKIKKRTDKLISLGSFFGCAATRDFNSRPTRNATPSSHVLFAAGCLSRASRRQFNLRSSHLIYCCCCRCCCRRCCCCCCCCRCWCCCSRNLWRNFSRDFMHSSCQVVGVEREFRPGPDACMAIEPKLLPVCFAVVALIFLSGGAAGGASVVCYFCC